jgi:hypothetical protein
MDISFGWFCLIGGIFGAIRNATAKHFNHSDFANQDGITTAEGKATEILMNPFYVVYRTRADECSMAMHEQNQCASQIDSK